MNQNNIKETFDDAKIKNISKAIWLCTMEHYPKTVGHMKLLISIVDKIGIFNKFNLAETSAMTAPKLNILYAILRITNKLFNGYLDYVVKKIFRDGLKEIFICTNLTYYDLFLDQLTQDIDHFVCSIIKTHCLNFTEQLIKTKMVEYFRSTFRKTFYENIMKKLSYDVGKNFYKNNNELFQTMTLEFITYTRETLTDTYDTMKIFLEIIFSNECSDQMLNEITSALEKHIDLKSLFDENCLEIDVYCEQKLDDELEWSSEKDCINWSDTIIPYNFDKMEIDEINALLKDIGYRVQNDKSDLNNLSILPLSSLDYVEKNERTSPLTFAFN